MRLCSECGKIMEPFSEDGVSFFKCKFCGWVEELSEFDNLSFKENSKFESKSSEVAEKSTIASQDFVCSKCGATKGQVFEKDCIVSDEAERKFFIRCDVCGFSQAFN